MRLQSDRTYSVSAAVCKSHIVSDTRHTASVVSLGLVCVYVSVCVFARFFLTDIICRSVSFCLERLLSEMTCYL